jgi:hypothetical protein
MSLVGGKLVKASSRALAVRDAAAAIRVEERKVVLSLGITLIRCQFMEALGLAIISLQSASALLVKERKAALRAGTSLVRGESV